VVTERIRPRSSEKAYATHVNRRVTSLRTAQVTWVVAIEEDIMIDTIDYCPPKLIHSNFTIYKT
jgi:hypothetical protein